MGRRRSIGDTHHYHVRSTLGSSGTPKQRNKRSLGGLLKISTENLIKLNNDVWYFFLFVSRNASLVLGRETVLQLFQCQFQLNSPLKQYNILDPPRFFSTLASNEKKRLLFA